VLVRPDLHVFEPIPSVQYFASLGPRVFVSSKEKGSAIGDYLEVIPKSHYARFDQFLNSPFEPQHCWADRNPPEFRLNWDGALHSYQKMPFLFAIVRGDLIADCVRLDNEVFERSRIDGVTPQELCQRLYPNT